MLLSNTSLTFSETISERPPLRTSHRRVSLRKPAVKRLPSPNVQVRRIVPNAPKKTKKSVSFRDTDLETVRLFFKTEMPSAVHSDPPLSEPTVHYELKYMNWPSSQSSLASHIRLESVQVSDDEKPFGLAGYCRVANIGFQKHVVVRYSLDSWASFKELEADYREPIVSTANTWERFGFTIGLDKPKDIQVVSFALRYTVNGKESWDNNAGNNYCLNLICHSIQQNDSSASEDDDDIDIDEFDRLSLSKEPEKLGFRYDFGASLTAAKRVWSPPPPLSHSPINDNEANGYFQVRNLWNTSRKHHITPQAYSATVQSDKTPLKEQQLPIHDYHAFVNKYCFYSPNEALFSPPGQLGLK
ncbi:putative phosphatase regulatory subunit-domain-containing protein [Phycomyces nitens]|nr:putative phosphatase regulatory subunit-domain-containing protein [Phycomyces nitens]